ncbi:DUF7344 domain-containing protein [Natrinema salinisoli]|uniref:DUF7344 domain-containing protein n=1 Tax=Natrinema salinisoli TaxID=2878535 RepID=UPI003CCD7553
MDSGPDSDELSVDTCLELLANRQRRVLLRFFCDSNRDRASIDELVTEIIDEEAAATGERPGHDSVSATVHHVHLPKLTDAGVLEYDTHNLEVRYCGDPRIEELYQTVKRFD